MKKKSAERNIMIASQQPPKISYSVYFAGDLFDHKHITGNQLLAQAIERESQNKYRCILPQRWEGASYDISTEIRNKDIAAVIQADVVLFNFDGTDIDSGTVVEFMIAKMIDVPVVLLRTDTRNGGYLFGEDWNLMLSGYPRVCTVKWDALLGCNRLNHDIDIMHAQIAQNIIAGFDRLRQEPMLLKTDDALVTAYQHVVHMCGGMLEKELPLHRLQKIAADKLQKQSHPNTQGRSETMTEY